MTTESQSCHQCNNVADYIGTWPFNGQSYPYCQTCVDLYESEAQANDDHNARVVAQGGMDGGNCPRPSLVRIETTATGTAIAEGKSKPQCQFAALSDTQPRCTEPATRKYGDNWFCEEHGKRNDKPTPPEPGAGGARARIPRCISGSATKSPCKNAASHHHRVAHWRGFCDEHKNHECIPGAPYEPPTAAPGLTPRTENYLENLSQSQLRGQEAFECVESFARTLERELAEARAEVERLTGRVDEAWLTATLEAKRADQAEQSAAGLRKALDKARFALTQFWSTKKSQNYYRPQYINDALTAIDEALAGASGDGKEGLKERIEQAISDALGGDAYDCLRVWSAWDGGTMSVDDFRPVQDEPERLSEIAEAVLGVLTPAGKP